MIYVIEDNLDQTSSDGTYVSRKKLFSALGSNEILGVTSPDLFVSNPIGDLRCLSRLEGAQRSSKYREIAQHLLQTQQVSWFSQG